MRIKENISLKPYNTFGVDVKATAFTQVDTLADLHQLILEGYLKEGKFLILGGGSNILFTKDFEGLVILNKIDGIEVKEVDAEQVLVTAGAGVVWDDLVRFCLDKGYGGIENLIMIPGSTGAGPLQNIGAYGVELKDTFYSLDAVELEGGTLRSFSNLDCEFGYRDSIFKKQLKGKLMIVSVSLLLHKDHKPDYSYGAIQDELIRMGANDDPGIEEVGTAIENIRGNKLPDPEKTGNAGSFFKNPVITEEIFEKIRNRYPEVPSYKGAPGLVKIPAGWMIEQCGWKGKEHGGAAVHDKQALVIVNKGNASGKEILRLARLIKASVFDEFGVDIEFEVNII